MTAAVTSAAVGRARAGSIHITPIAATVMMILHPPMLWGVPDDCNVVFAPFILSSLMVWIVLSPVASSQWIAADSSC